MSKEDNYFNRRFLWGNALAWILIFALTASESIFYYQFNQRPVPYWNIFINDLFILCWIPISPFLFALIKRWYKRRKTLTTFGFKVFVAGIVAFILVLGFESTVHYIDRVGGEQERDWINIYIQLISFRLHSNLVLFLGYSGVSVAILAYAESKKRAENEVELRKNLVEAQLGVLKAQMKPHFLFNSLHAISGLILKEKNELAITIIAKLSDLLRDSLNMDEKKWITLEEELAFIERYLEIYVMRFGEQLTYSFHVENGLNSAWVPPALLQPIVENSLVHGVVPNDNQGHIEIAVSKKHNRLLLAVKDNCADDQGTGDIMNEGVGLRNTRKRLSSLYDNEYELSFASNQETFMTTISIPLTNNDQ